METTMQINRETAMSLWNKQFGKADKVKDFAGREMAKGAYDDRNSQYGWNVDHILPVSRGGKTTDSNLICCHILTNDEKADKFPCFSANERQFEIRKVENHYEIKTKNSEEDTSEDAEGDVEENEAINFFDSAAGIRFYEEKKQAEEKGIFVGTVKIWLGEVQSMAILDFIGEIFSGKNIDFSSAHYGIMVTVMDHDMSRKEYIADLLDRCVLLNTYLEYYFQPKSEIGRYQIFFGVHFDKKRWKALNTENGWYTFPMSSANDNSGMYINALVKINTDADRKIGPNDIVGRDSAGYQLYRYNYIYTRLADNLKKSVQ